MQYGECQVVEIDKGSLSVAGDIDFQCLCSDPEVLAGILVCVQNKVIALSSMQDDVVQVLYWLEEESISCNQSELVTVNGESVERMYRVMLIIKTKLLCLHVVHKVPILLWLHKL